MRSPLTRSHLSRVEERVRKLEAILGEIIPNVDIEALLSKSSNRRGRVLSNAGTNSGVSEATPAIPGQPRERHPKLPAEEAPDEADGFDWVEEELVGNDLSDGMAALSINPQNTGYFGVASSSVLLRALRIDPDVYSPPRTTELAGVPFDSAPVPKYITDTLVDAYFTYYHHEYPFIHEATFRAQYLGVAPRPREDVWELLLNAVLALGAWCINSENSTADLTFYQNARSRLTSSILETGSLPLVQALTLLSNYVQKRNKPNTGWNYLGLALRMAIGLGLHREFPGWNSSPLKQEMRRRSWWGLFIFDAGAAVTFGRPIDLPEWGAVDAKLVQNVNDEDLTADTVVVPRDRDEMTMYSGLIEQTKFTLKMNPIYNRLISKPSPTANEVLEMNKQIDNFADALPSYMRDLGRDDGYMFTRFRLQWRYRNLQIIMFRPFILQRVLSEGGKPVPSLNSPEEKVCRRLCLRAAHETIVSVQNFVHTCPQRTSIAVWYAVYFLFQACLIPLVCACSEPDSEHASRWMDDVEQTKAVLQELSAKNNLALRFLDVIQRLCVQYLQYNDDSNAPSGRHTPIPKSEWMTDIYSLFFNDIVQAPEDFNFDQPLDRFEF